jgi:hypothetical protein
MSTQPLKDTSELEVEVADLRRRLARLEADDVAADTISEFCRRHRISRAYYYLMKAEGCGPRELRPGPRGTGPILITREAQAEWRRLRTAETAQQTLT